MNAPSSSTAAARGGAPLAAPGGNCGSSSTTSTSSSMLSEQQFQESLEALAANEGNWMEVAATTASSSENPMPAPGRDAPRAPPRGDPSLLSPLGAFSAFREGQVSMQMPPPVETSAAPRAAAGTGALNLDAASAATALGVGSEAALQLLVSSAWGPLLGLTAPQQGGAATASSLSSSLAPQSCHSSQVTFAPIQSAAQEEASRDSQPMPPPASASLATSAAAVKPTTSAKRRRRSGTMAASSAEFPPASAVSEDEGDRSRRSRQDRNHREQQRSQHIAQQIGLLRDLLAASHVRFKPDKYSTLVTVGDFIKSLQERSELLESEHQKLLATLVQTTQAVNGQHLPQPNHSGATLLVTASVPWTATTAATAPTAAGGGSLAGLGSAVASSSSSSSSTEAANASCLHVTDVFEDPVADGKISPLENDVDVEGDGGANGEAAPPAFVNTLDYKAVFECCPVASAVTSIDGRFLDCNSDFEALSGFAKHELLSRLPLGEVGSLPPASSAADGKRSAAKSLSLFNVVRREHMEPIFRAMSEMLKLPFPNEEGGSSADPLDSDYWSGTVSLVRHTGSPKVKLLVSLVRSLQGRPKFFSCTLLPVDDAPPPIGEVVTTVAAAVG